MQEVVAIVNFIKASAVNSRLFEQLCVRFGSEFQHLLFYSSVRWLSHGKVLRRVVDLQTELQIFFIEKHRHAIRFDDKPWMLKVYYLNDVFATVNELKMSMQGRDHNILTLNENLFAFKTKLHLWKGRMERGRTAAFPSLNEYLEEWDEGALDAVKPILLQHLGNLIVDFDRYIPDVDHAASAWIRDPFLVKAEDVGPEEIQEQLIELQHDHHQRLCHSTTSLGEFWTQSRKTKAPSAPQSWRC